LSLPPAALGPGRLHGVFAACRKTLRDGEIAIGPSHTATGKYARARGRRDALTSCSAHQIASITGHATFMEVEPLRQGADRKRMRREGMTRLIDGDWRCCTSGEPERKKSTFGRE